MASLTIPYVQSDSIDASVSVEGLQVAKNSCVQVEQHTIVDILPDGTYRLFIDPSCLCAHDGNSSDAYRPNLVQLAAFLGSLSEDDTLRVVCQTTSSRVRYVDFYYAGLSELYSCKANTIFEICNISEGIMGYYMLACKSVEYSSGFVRLSPITSVLESAGTTVVTQDSVYKDFVSMLYDRGVKSKILVEEDVLLLESGGSVVLQPNTIIDRL
jgi:hypothetical protein